MMQLNLTGGCKTIAIKIKSHVRIDKLPAEFENDKKVMLWALIPKIARDFYKEYYANSIYDNFSYPETTTITISAIKVYDKALTRIDIIYTTNNSDTLQSKYLNLIHDKDLKYYEYEVINDGSTTMRATKTTQAPKMPSPKITRSTTNKLSVEKPRPTPPPYSPRLPTFGEKHPAIKNALIGAGIALTAVTLTAAVVAVAFFTGGIGIAAPISLLATTAVIGGISTSSIIITTLGAALGATIIGAGLGVFVSWYKQHKLKSKQSARQTIEESDEVVLPTLPRTTAKQDANKTQAKIINKPTINKSADDIDMNDILKDLQDLQDNLAKEEYQHKKTQNHSFNLFPSDKPKAIQPNLATFKEDVLSEYFKKDGIQLRRQRIMKYSDPAMFTRFCDMVLNNKNTANYKRMDAAINTILNKEEYKQFDRESLRTTPIYQHLYPVKGFFNRIVNTK